MEKQLKKLKAYCYKKGYDVQMIVREKCKGKMFIFTEIDEIVP